MENNWGIMGLREDEIELDLGLSIGGSFGKAQKLKPIKNESKPNNNTVADLGESVAFDPQTKRELQALRRQEARKKREHKQQKRGTCHRNGEFHIKDYGANATEERECKKTKVQEFPVNGNPNFSAELNSPLVCPVIPVRVPCPYPPLQFVPLGNGFAYSCVNAVPCWGGVAGNEKGAVQPVADGGEWRVSVVSDGSGFEGGCSSEIATHTPRINCSVASNLNRQQSEQSATSHQTDSAQSIDKSRKDTKGETGKPPKPHTPTNDDALSLRNMPCVSTTGNGPNGKTINGFLYRYTKSEVSIICVCHGSSFTPAEFVQHAGGTDVSHPLRHITMIPSAF
ncbi:hypothetical protein GOBAR_DD20607 [Gossypium barbadense]|nr:hypothetical protein GOBAR_DD20607 [Gossypium barbadense]